MSPVSLLKRHPRWSAAIAVTLWLSTLAAGFTLLNNEQVRAGDPARAPGMWPASTRLVRTPGRPTLLVFAHPRCACTRATLRELERLLARSGARAITYVVLVLPPGAPDDWTRSSLAQEARALPGTTVRFDVGGVEARRFGTLTSGQALLYDTQGALLFAGGLTPGRGHEGDNAGSDALLAGIDGAAPETRETDVYGCALTGPGKGSALPEGNP